MSLSEHDAQSALKRALALHQSGKLDAAEKIYDEILGNDETRSDVLTLLGTPYLWGGRTRTGLDCSGLVQTVFHAHGVELPRTAGDQALAGRAVGLAEVRAGDLLFFGLDGITHVAMYLGGTKLVEAANPTSGIQVSDMTYTWYRTNLYAAGRVSIGS